MNNKVKELVDNLGRIIYIQKHSKESWNDLVPEIKEVWLEVAKDYFRSHPDLALIDRERELPKIIDTISHEFFLTREQIGVLLLRLEQSGYLIPLAEALKEGQ